MAEFESACERLDVPLSVPPPRSPRYNGCVERADRPIRAEFRNLCNGPLTVTDVAPGLARYELFYSDQRPYASLACRAPNEYRVALEATDRSVPEAVSWYTPRRSSDLWYNPRGLPVTEALKTTLKAEIDPAAWATLHSDLSRPFDRPRSGRIAVKVINHLGDEAMKVFRV